MELHLNQLQALAVLSRREIDLLGGVVVRQSKMIDIQRRMLLEMDAENRRKFKQLERMLDPRGRTLGDPIVIKDSEPVEDVVTLVGHEE